MGRKKVGPPYSDDDRRRVHEALDKIMDDYEMDAVIVAGKLKKGGIAFATLGDKNVLYGLLYRLLNKYFQHKL